MRRLRIDGWIHNGFMDRIRASRRQGVKMGANSFVFRASE